MVKLSEIASSAAERLREAVMALGGDVGIFRTLKTEHQELALLLRRMDAGERVEEHDLERRQELFRRIRRQLLAHGRAEEAHLYAPLDQHRRTQPLVSECRAEHEDMERLITEMEPLSPLQAEWAARFKMLRMKLLEHFQKEEHEVFPRAHRVIGRDRARELDRLYRSERSKQLEGLGAGPSEVRH